MLGRKIKVLTSLHFPHTVGEITAYCRVSVTVTFPCGSVGIYTIDKNTFEIVEDSALLPEIDPL